MRLGTVFCLLLAACSGQDSDPEQLSAEDQAKANTILDAYASARDNQNWEAAVSQADRLRHRYPGSEAAAKLKDSIANVREQAGQTRELRRLRGLWDYQAISAGKGQQRTAAIYSRTVVVEEGQLAPLPDAQLVLRDHPSWGRSVYLLLAQSRFECGKPCAMQISFDDGPNQRFAGKQADSGKGPALFVVDKQAFIDAMSKSKKVRVELPKGSGTIPALVFEVGGYLPARFESP